MKHKSTLFKIENKNKKRPLRRCVELLLERDLKIIKNKKLLEIGCGTWDFSKKILEKNNNQWFGLEPVDFQNKNLTIIKGSVKKIPFHDNSFDYVLCNQTIEHWFEYNVSLKNALKEINRILKPNGILMINAPIHNHGDPRFLIGEFNKIRSIFKKNLWNIVLFEKVFPRERIKGWKKIAAKGFFSKFGYPNFLIPNSKNAKTYLLNIHAVKKNIKEIKNSKNNKLRPFFVMIKFIKTYIKARFS